VLDVAYGTGVLARRTSTAVEWREGRAESLPFEDDAFDAVLCQVGLMFFDDRRASLREMMRVAKPGGRIAVAVWDALERTPGYAAMTALLQRLFGDAIADALRAPFNRGDIAALRSVFAEAGIEDVTITTADGTARFPSIAAWVNTDVKGWTLAGRLSDAEFAALSAEAEKDLSRFVTADGTVAFPSPAHIVTTMKR
jgi:SAM-dependent methyltransferase